MAAHRREPSLMPSPPRARESPGLGGPAALGSPQAGRDGGWWVGLTLGLSFSLLLLLLSGAIAWRLSRRARAIDEPAAAMSPAQRGLTAGVSAASAALLAFMIATFRFAADDFFQLLRAAAQPFSGDESLRVALTALFTLGVKLGPGVWPFALANALATTALLYLAWRAFARIGGRAEALLAAAWIGFAPGLYELVRWGVGFQQLASMAIAIGVLNVAGAFAAASSQGATRRAAALAALAAGLGAAGVFVKYPSMIMVPLAAVLWSTVVARPACSPRRGVALGIGIALGICIPFLLAYLPGRDGELEKVGARQVASNLVLVVNRCMGPVGQSLLAMAVLYLAGKRRRASGAPSMPGEGLDRRQKVGLFLVAAALAVPYLFNARYFAVYYVILPVAMIAPILAGALLRLARAAPRWSAVLAAPLLLPVSQIYLHTAPSPFNEVGKRMEEVAEASRGLPRASRILIALRCEDPALLSLSREELGELFHLTEEGTGLRWATGWTEARVDRAEDAGEAGGAPGDTLALAYCHGQPIRRYSGSIR